MLVALIVAAALAQSVAGATIDFTIPLGATFDNAEFRLWYAPATETVHATLVLVPGSNGDGRPITDDRVLGGLRPTVPPRHRLLPLHRQAARSSLHRTVRQRLAGQRPGAARCALWICRSRAARRARHGAAAVLEHVGGRRVQLRVRDVEARARVAVFVVNNGGIC